jgi:DNA-binding ferritin-like protein (Dps family)
VYKDAIIITEKRKEVIKMLDKIKNLPEYAYSCEAIVYREVDGELWFWGATDNDDLAIKMAEEIGGKVFWMD